MKSLKDVLKNEKLDVEELMTIKGGVIDKPGLSKGCDDLACVSVACATGACSGVSCKNNTCTSKGCTTGA